MAVRSQVSNTPWHIVHDKNLKNSCIGYMLPFSWRSVQRVKSRLLCHRLKEVT